MTEWLGCNYTRDVVSTERSMASPAMFTEAYIWIPRSQVNVPLFIKENTMVPSNRIVSRNSVVPRTHARKTPLCDADTANSARSRRSRKRDYRPNALRTRFLILLIIDIDPLSVALKEGKYSFAYIRFRRNMSDSRGLKYPSVVTAEW